MPRLARRVEFVGLMLLGLLPTYAINTHAVQKLDPAAAFAAAAPCARPPRPGRAVAGEPGPALCGARVPQWRSAGRPSGLVRLRCAAANGQHPNGPHAGHVAARNAAHGLQAREKILVTGGAGYIGSHICADLLQKDYDVVVLDNFVNSSPTALQRAMELGGRELTVYEGDTRDLAALRHVFESELTISSVIHLAGLKAVGESVAKPTMYYDFNVAGSINLMQVMSEYNCKKMVFSSSATVYGETTANPIKETEPLGATSPYGRSKLMVEDMLRDQCKADPEWGVAILRYFNPVGAHPSGLLGEDPKGIPNNLMPFITKVATGAQPQLKIFGNDYPTRDGTGVRDYLHVMDLSQGHLAAIEALNKGLTGAEPFNLGTGVGVSVLEMVDAFSKARGAPIPYVIEERRPGDVAECYADSSKALDQLGWKAQCSVDDMCRDVLTWTSKNPEGFGSGVAVAADSVLHAKAPSPAPLRSYVAGTQTSGGKRVSLNARNAPVRVKA